MPYSPILLACASVGLISLVVSARTVHYKWTYDDIFAILKNPVVSGDAGLGKVMELDFWGYQLNGGDGWSHKSWRPMTTLLWRLLNRASLGRCEPEYLMHAGNAVAYALSSGAGTHAAWSLMELADPEGGKGVRFVTAALCGALFALHPVHSEVVGNVTHGAEIYASLFVFAAMSYWAGRKAVGWKEATLVGALGLGATLCKETGLMVVPFVGVSEALVARRRGWVEFVGILVVICGVVAGGRGMLTLESNFSINTESNPLVGKDRWSTEWFWGVAEGHLDAIGLMMLPWAKKFCFDRVFEGSGKAAGLEIWIFAMYGSFLGLLGIGFIGNGTAGGKVTLLSLILFGTFYLPASQIPFSVGFYVAERTLYVPVLGVIVLVGWVWERGVVGMEKMRGGQWGALALFWVAVIGTASLGAMFGDSVEMWENKQTLYERVLKVNGRSYNAMRGLGEYWHFHDTEPDSEKVRGAYLTV